MCIFFPYALKAIEIKNQNSPKGTENVQKNWNRHWRRKNLICAFLASAKEVGNIMISIC